MRTFGEGLPADFRLAAGFPALGHLLIGISALRLEDELIEVQALSKVLAKRAQAAYDGMIADRTNVRVPPGPPPQQTHDQWKSTGCFYGAPQLRYRPVYEGRDADKTDKVGNGACRKFYTTYSKSTLTGGLMALWCPHLVCLGFHKIRNAEGRDDVFSAIFTHFEHAPRTIIYDYACQLQVYSMYREPEFFKDTLFVVDQMHAKGHVGCSGASFFSSYKKFRPDLLNVNSSAAECGNSGLSRIKKSISYMNESHAIQFAYVYLCIWNRRRERLYQQTMAKELADLPNGAG